MHLILLMYMKKKGKIPFVSFYVYKASYAGLSGRKQKGMKRHVHTSCSCMHTHTHKKKTVMATDNNLTLWIKRLTCSALSLVSL